MVFGLTWLAAGEAFGEVVTVERACQDAGQTLVQSAVEQPVPFAVTQLNKCLEACDKGGETFKKFCRSLKSAKLRAGCWALQFAKKTACKGWCYWNFDED